MKKQIRNLEGEAGFSCVSIPTNLAKLIDDKTELYGYSSRADFVKQACRRELERLYNIGRERYEFS